MKKLLLSFFITIPFSAITQINFSIKISFNFKHSPNYIFVSQRSERKIDTILFPKNNFFEYYGTASQPGIFVLKTDSSNPIQFWADDKPISFNCSDEKTKNNFINLVITNLEGSEDAKLLFQMTQARVVSSPVFYPPSLSKEQRDSISNATRFKWYIFHYNIIDSIFNVRPNSPIIPYYIRYYQRTLGSDTVALFYKRLSNELQNSEEGLKIKEFLDRSVLLKKGNIIENFSMRNQKGKTQSLYSVSSKYILLDFWASWCMPCRSENPNLVKLYKKYHDKGFKIIGISFDEKKEDWLKAIEKDKLEWIHISELKGWENSIAEKYKISTVPFTILLDKNYKVVAVNFSAGQLEPLLNELMK